MPPFPPGFRRTPSRPRRIARRAFLGLDRLEGRALLAAPAASAVDPSAYAQLPLSFEPNQGQADPSVQYISHGGGYALALAPGGASLELTQPGGATSGVRMRLLGADSSVEPTGQERLPGVVNYLIGKDSSRWHTDIATYEQVAYHGVYPGVDLLYHGEQGQLEYDFIVAPGASPGRIGLSFDGASSMALDPQGNLILHAAGGDVEQHAPVLYQEVSGARVPVSGSFAIGAGGRVGFAVGAYDPGLPLVIDPVLAYSTPLGGFADNGQGNAIAVDSRGSAYVTGVTGSTDFPITPGAFQSTLSSAVDVDAYVSKLNSAGTALVYSTFLGGDFAQAGQAIAVDSNGDAYVTGYTTSDNFPTTSNGIQTFAGGKDIFVTELNPSGTAPILSSYAGGTGDDAGDAIAVDASGRIYVAGSTTSTGGAFPVTVNAFQKTTAVPAAFVARFDAADTTQSYVTLLGGGGFSTDARGIAVNALGDAFVTGSTTSGDFPTTSGALNTRPNSLGSAYVTEFNANGSALIYSTYLDGTNHSAGDAIAVDPTGDAYVAGNTDSRDFPVTPGALKSSNSSEGNAFVSELKPDGTGLVYSTFLGGSGGETGQAIATDARGDVFVAGSTDSPDFPTSPGAFQVVKKTGFATTAFFTELDRSRRLDYSTYLGGSGGESASGIAVDASGNAYITGSTSSTDFPTLRGIPKTFRSGSSHGFVAKIAARPALGDYFGGGGANLGVYDTSRAVFLALPTASESAAPIIQGFGNPAHDNIPLSGDYFGGGVVNVGIYDATASVFYILPTAAESAAGVAPIVLPFGNPAHNNIPLSGDYFGGGVTDVGIYDATASVFYILPTAAESAAGSGPIVLPFGNSSHANVPLSGDYFGGGVTNLGIYDRTASVFYILPATAGITPIVLPFGNPAHNNIPLSGDYFGGGVTDVGIYDATASVFYILPTAAESAAGSGPIVLPFGNSSHANVPLSGDYFGGGVTNLGIFDRTASVFYILPATAGITPIVVQFGSTSDLNVPLGITQSISTVHLRSLSIARPAFSSATDQAIATLFPAGTDGASAILASASRPKVRPPTDLPIAVPRPMVIRLGRARQAPSIPQSEGSGVD